MDDIDPTVECVDCGHTAMQHADTELGAHTGGCNECDCSAMNAGASADVSGDPTDAGQPSVSDTESMGAIAYQKTGTSDGPWDGGAAEKALGDAPTEDACRALYAWVDPDGDPTTKSAYKFPHHEVTDGRVGAANMTACSSVIAILNGGQGGADIPDGDKQGVYDHVAHHLRDGGKDVPDANFSFVSTLAPEVTGGSGASTGDADSIAQQLDQVVDDLSTGNDDADALVQAADAAIDLYLATRGVDNPDEEVTVGPGGGDDDPADLAAACQAALKAAAQLAPDNDDLKQALDLAGRLMDALGPDAMTADAGIPGNTQDFEMPIMVIMGVDTGDGRFIDKDALTWREPPLPAMGILKTTPGHDEAELVGRIDSCEVIDISSETNPKTGQPYGDGITAVRGVGKFTSLDNAQQIADLIREGFIRGVSVDLGDVESVIELVDADGNVVDEEEDPFLDLLLWSEETEWLADDEEPEPAPDTEPDEGNGDEQFFIRERITKGRIMGATICPFPAFEGAYIKLADGTESPTDATEPAEGVTAGAAVRVVDDPFARTCEPCEGGAMVASAAPLYPPRAWFEVEEPDELTPLTITDDGQIFGHAAGWQSCHRGFPGKCLLATRSRTNYAHFMKGAVKTAEGDVIPAGVITMGTGHASTDPSVTMQEALAHYDNTGTVAAMVTARDGKHGIWVCGALEPDIDELAIRRLRGSALSGDWRPHGRGIEMIACLAVNTPGFLVPRVTTRHGRVAALVAAGVVHQPPEKAREAALPPTLDEFVKYVLSKDAKVARERMQAAAAASRKLTEDRVSRTADVLRARIHGR